MFREKHGEDCNQFMDSSLMDAVTIARIEQKPILVYMSSPLHENEEAFQKVLSSPSVVEYLKKDCVCWGCDVTSKYGYSLFLEMNFPILELPTVIMLMKKDETSPLTLLGVIRYSNGMNADQFLTSLNTVISGALAEIQEEELARQRIEENRRLAEQQQREYEAALEADRQMMESATAEETEESIVSPIDSTRSERMEVIREHIPIEPTEGELVRLRVVYPDGTKLQRNFLLSDDVGFLLDLVELDMYDNHMENELSELYMTMPRITVNENSRGKSFEDMNIKGNCVLRVRTRFVVSLNKFLLEYLVFRLPQ
ncbi:FAS-associated factor like [Blastocystis sp. subtype 4]|uniref:FAS-associated factor like n=1 Tax=Blastocystis sp. subtype 4 TaxID=944170 RepID=UPI0007121AAF|nr:FAS-associated factor like [Blastocystis sp. subtype 4]KNB42970.1 FAS-associated factor like [Blastocystis sp. subtype 4]|eukprot:XP_014526413.1 FAS-associated factor like [Blastocystis sp. subtype 4]